MQNAFSGQSLYESWNLSLYNLIFTVAPPFVMGIFDQFIFARHLDHYAGIYEFGQKGMFFQMHSFFLWIFNGVYHSLLLYFVSQFIWSWDPTQGDGRAAGHWVWGTALYTAVLATVLGKAALVTDTWTKYTFLAIPGSMILWMIFIPLYATVESRLDPSEENIGVALRLFSSPAFWFMALLLPVACLLRDFSWK
jgi:phospholipid-transporting ATPase